MGKHYYISSFVWTGVAKILNALVGFVSVPLLMGYFGKAPYGIIALATACNGYMHLLDLGMNTGAVKFYSAWRSQGRDALINRVARTNITFYFVIALLNAIILLSLAFWGEGVFSITHGQFLDLRSCLIIIAIFSVFSWGATSFNQLLVSDGQMAFTMKAQCVQALLKAVLVAIVLFHGMSLVQYFFWLTFIIAALIVPYMVECLRRKLLFSVRPLWDWASFKPVLAFSLSIFALSIFQMTATASRPIILSMFSADGASIATDFRVLEVIPGMIIMIGGTFSAIFLPKSSAMVATGDNGMVRAFADKWTLYTSVIANILCVPFMLCAREALSAYVGVEYSNLSVWLVLWCLTVLIQIHTSPGNSLIIARGRTIPLVGVTAAACVISIVINAMLCRHYGAGSAVIGYFVYVLIVIGVQYLYFYKKLINLGRLTLLRAFLVPTLLALVPMVALYFLRLDFGGSRMAFFLVCALKSILWLIIYVGLLLGTRVIKLDELRDEYRGTKQSGA